MSEVDAEFLSALYFNETIVKLDLRDNLVT